MVKEMLFTQPTPESVSLKLRQLRKSRGWSLQDIEDISHGRLKAVVLGSYERGDRALSLKRAIEIATFYGIPVGQLLQIEPPQQKVSNLQVVIDLRRLSKTAPRANFEEMKFEALLHFVRVIAEARSDWNGEVMSLRSVDLDTLSLMSRCSQSELLSWLGREKLLLNSPS